MGHSVERSAEIDSNRHSAVWRWELIETPGNVMYQGKQGRAGRTLGPEAVLRVRQKEVVVEEWEDKAFQNLRHRAEKGDRAVGGTGGYGLARLGNGHYVSGLPH